jgi:hypothetical protein
MGMRFGGGGAELHGRYCPNSGSVGEAWQHGWKSCLAGPVTMVPAGVVHLLGGVAEVSWYLPHSLGLGCCLWAKASIRSRIDMMATSSTSYLCWVHRAWRHGLEVLLLFSGARYCPRVVYRGTMHAMAGESKTMSSRNWPSSAIFLFGWCVHKGSSFGVVQRRSRRDFVA